jgi:uncharacterized protein (TIGR02284 family)
MDANLCAAVTRCIRACIDAEKGYAIAAADARDPVLRAVFLVYQRQRADFVDALQSTIDRREGNLANAGSLAGTVHRNWLDGRLALERRDDAIVLDEVARGERAALRVYAAALQCAHGAPAEVRAMLEWHAEAIENALEDVRSRSRVESSAMPRAARMR